VDASPFIAAVGAVAHRDAPVERLLLVTIDPLTAGGTFGG
jgi:hypothetical protein